jgi:hypothetical protein
MQAGQGRQEGRQGKAGRKAREADKQGKSRQGRVRQGRAIQGRARQAGLGREAVYDRAMWAGRQCMAG